jgi:hypothetical protein
VLPLRRVGVLPDDRDEVAVLVDGVTMGNVLFSRISSESASCDAAGDVVTSGRHEASA